MWSQNGCWKIAAVADVGKVSGVVVVEVQVVVVEKIV